MRIQRAAMDRGEDTDPDDAESGGELCGQNEAQAGTSSAGREMRNRAEAARRAKLNTLTMEIGVLTPWVQDQHPKKVDKTSTLRLGANYLRTFQMVLQKMSGQKLHITSQNCAAAMDMLTEELGCVFFIFSAPGKILYATDSVEQMLGRHKVDLLGTNIYEWTYSEDVETLKRNLQPDEDPMAERMLMGGDDSSSDTATSASMSSAQSSPDTMHRGTPDPSPLGEPPGQAPTSPLPEPEPTLQKRDFHVRLMQRLPSSKDPPHYETVSMQGYLCIPGRTAAHGPGRARGHGANAHRRGSHDTSATNDDIFLYAIARIRTEQPLSLLDSSSEYITRHTMDGRIIYCDHRISLVAGYMSDEVAGDSAFRYMHKDDVKWAMVALGQMYNTGHGYGNSCYRLKTKNGDFIYLRTYGYMEKDSENTATSFLCVNALVSTQEGEAARRDMEQLYSAVVPRKSEVVITELPDSTESEETLEPLVNTLLLSNNPSMNVGEGGFTPNPQYSKITLISKNLPPATHHTTRLGLVNVPQREVASPVPRSPSISSPTWSPQHGPQDVSSSSEDEFIRPSVLQLSRSSSSGRKRPHEGHVRDDEPKRVYQNIRRTPPNIQQKNVDVNPSLPLRGTSPMDSPQAESRGPFHSRVGSQSGSVDYSTLDHIGGPVSGPLDGPTTCPNSPHGVFPNGGCRSGAGNHQTGPAHRDPTQTYIYSGEELPMTFPSEENNVLGVTGEQPLQRCQDTQEQTQQLLRQQFQVSTNLHASSQQITNLTQDLMRVPHNNPERLMIEDRVVELQVEQIRQERMLQELHRETCEI